MLADLTEGRADTLVAWTWDRLTRNRRDTLRLIETCQAAKITVALVRGSDIDMSTASGRLVADLLAGVSRAEIDAKGERQRRAGLQRAEAGRAPARRAFGYCQDGNPHPEEAPIVKTLFADFLVGATMTGLARKLNADGHPTTRGKPWDDTGIRALLRNPRYIAERWYRGERVAVGEWPPLVSPATFQAAQDRLSSGVERRPARRHLGSRLYRCHCGALVKVSYDAQGYRAYVCEKQAHMKRRADPVDELVLQVIAARLRREDLAGLLAAEQPHIDVTGLRRQAVALREQIDQLGVDHARKLLTAGQVRAATRQLENDLAAIETQLAEAGRESALAPVLDAPDPGTAWLGLPLDRQRAVLGALAEVVILPGRPGRPRRDETFDVEQVRFDWRTP